ncbi:hypothetical protein L6164_014793 [Bauhinia variegata]|uniref:Uncharacterized protein n=1 Tax=Bauhinia variegata TaxID=167791 RepID=A0ACB9NNC7_BAUVA|nr:hypothetical protein L6164_014793 [Bauhinia variegata]
MPVSPALAYGCRYSCANASPLRHLLISTLLHHHKRTVSAAAHSAIITSLFFSPFFPKSNFLTGNTLFSRMEVIPLSFLYVLQRMVISFV